MSPSFGRDTLLHVRKVVQKGRSLVLLNIVLVPAFPPASQEMVLVVWLGCRDMRGGSRMQNNNQLFTQMKYSNKYSKI